MIRIEMNPNDQKDIIELLDFALEMKYVMQPTKYGSFNDYGYWKIRIPQLKVVLLGKNTSPAIYKSSLGGANGNNNTTGTSGELEELEKDIYF